MAIALTFNGKLEQQKERIMAIPTGMHAQGNTHLSPTSDGLGLTLPPGLVARCGLASGTEVEVYVGDDGIYLRPIGIEPWFSAEWEQALKLVMEYHGEVIEALGN